MFQSGRVLSAMLACAALAACGDPPSEAPASTNSTTRAATGKTSAVPPNMVAAVSASKSSLIIGVHFALGAPPVVGQPLPVDIAVVPHQPFSTLRLHVIGPDGLKVASGSEMSTQSGITAGKALTHQVILEPAREGVFMVSAAVDTVGDEGNITRVYSIPIIVSATAPAAGTPPPTTPAAAPAG